MLASLRAHRSKLLLTALATFIGAAFVTSTLALGATLGAGVDRQVERNAAGVAAVAVTDNQQRPLGDDVLARIRTLPGVTAADGMIDGPATVLGPDRRPLRDAPVGISVTMRTRLVEGTPPTTDDQVVVAAQTARGAGVGVGGTIRVLDARTGDPRTFHVTGILDVQGQGELAQAGQQVRFTLTRGPGTPVVRPQTPARPVPYNEDDIDVEAADGIRLSGTLTTPPGAGPHPAVVLITGSGELDRDETVADHKPFEVLADALARAGVAALRVDDRGVGGSTGPPEKSATTNSPTTSSPACTCSAAGPGSTRTGWG